jgi:hypothetical protein
MARSLTCDICRKPTDSIVAKLYYSPLVSGKKSHHASYTFHLDVGICCNEKIKRAFGWRKRTTAAEYQASRRRNREVA